MMGEITGIGVPGLGLGAGGIEGPAVEPGKLGFAAMLAAVVPATSVQQPLLDAIVPTPTAPEIVENAVSDRDAGSAAPLVASRFLLGSAPLPSPMPPPFSPPLLKTTPTQAPTVDVPDSYGSPGDSLATGSSAHIRDDRRSDPSGSSTLAAQAFLGMVAVSDETLPPAQQPESVATQPVSTHPHRPGVVVSPEIPPSVAPTAAPEVLKAEPGRVFEEPGAVVALRYEEPARETSQSETDSIDLSGIAIPVPLFRPITVATPPVERSLDRVLVPVAETGSQNAMASNRIDATASPPVLRPATDAARQATGLVATATEPRIAHPIAVVAVDPSHPGDAGLGPVVAAAQATTPAGLGPVVEVAASPTPRLRGAMPIPETTAADGGMRRSVSRPGSWQSRISSKSEGRDTLPLAIASPDLSRPLSTTRPAVIAAETPQPAATPQATAALGLAVETDRLGAVHIGIEGASDDLRVSLGLAPSAAAIVTADAPRLLADLAASGLRVQSLDVSGGGLADNGFRGGQPAPQRQLPVIVGSPRGAAAADTSAFTPAARATDRYA